MSPTTNPGQPLRRHLPMGCAAILLALAVMATCFEAGFSESRSVTEQLVEAIPFFVGTILVGIIVGLFIGSLGSMGAATGSVQEWQRRKEEKEEERDARNRPDAT